MVKLIAAHLRALTRFSGREARQPFWLWVLAVIATAMVAWMGYFIALFRQLDQLATANPDHVTRTVGPGTYSIQFEGSHPEVGAAFATSAMVMAIICAVVIMLLAAAVARRLHDSGRTGWWGVPTPTLLMTGLLVMAHVFAVADSPSAASLAGEPPIDFAWFGLMMLCNLTYLGSLAMLVVLCCMPGQTGDNRHGAPVIGGETS
jgi:uncharacterized membrane protein YhaH (DUF805 family)